MIVDLYRYGDAGATVVLRGHAEHWYDVELTDGWYYLVIGPAFVDETSRTPIADPTATTLN